MESNRGPIYRSRALSLDLTGFPVLTDFGQMRLGDQTEPLWWMSDLYRAPEVLLGLPWNCGVDLWSVGIMVSRETWNGALDFHLIFTIVADVLRFFKALELLEGKNLFDPLDRVHNQYVLPLALAQYISILGPPPLDMLKQSPLFSTYFDGNGSYNSRCAAVIFHLPFESLVSFKFEVNN